MKKLQFTITLLALIGAVSTAPSALAQTWNQKTILTFSGPVEIPGKVLPAGKYVFKLADSSSNRHIVQVFNEDQNRIFGTFLAIPDYWMKPVEKTIVTFNERPEGQPPALKAWFYPGHNYGHEFVYPKAEAVSLARANDTPVPAVESMPEPRTTTRLQILALNAVPIKAEEPDGSEVEIAEAFGTATAQTESPHVGLSEELPHTASFLPLAGLAGVFFLGAAGALRFAVATSR
jgi:hypothetical protein